MSKMKLLAPLAILAWAILRTRKASAADYLANLVSSPGAPSAPIPVPPSSTQIPTPATRIHPVAALAEQELQRWGMLDENDSDARPILDKYWTDGASQSPQPASVPWSAAFITWVANTAVPGSLFATGAHIFYAHAAAQGKGRYRALPPDTAIRVGDIVVKNRGGSSVDFSDLGDGQFRPTHGDIVTQVKRNSARAIGGNVGNAVSVTNYALDDGRLAPSEGVFVVLRLT